MTGRCRPVPSAVGLAIAALVLMAAALLSACGTAIVTGSGASTSAVGYLSDIRRENGLPPLSPDSALERAAAQQAGYMAGSGRMQHTTGWSKAFAARMKANGIEGAAAENIAEGRMDLDRLFSMWMNSSGHRRNMLDPRFSRFGLASAPAKDGSRYWALVLGR